MASNSSETNKNEKNEEITKQFALQKIKEKMEQLKIETSAQINEHLQRMMNEIFNDIEEKEVLVGQMQKLFTNHCRDEIQDKVKTKEGHLPDKHFTTRNSLLTDLMEIKHIQTIYHIFLATLFALFVNTTAYDLLHKGQIKLGFDLIFRAFVNFHTLMFVWTCMFLSTLTVYIGFHFWATVRIQLLPKSVKLKFWDKLSLGLFAAYFPCFIYFYTSCVIEYKLTVAESVAALCELTRFLMKAYAFIRSNVPRVLRYKLHTENQTLCPEFTKFLYFLFAPTLVYKDNYPRSKHIKWSYVATCFVEVLGCIIYISFVFERFLVPFFEDYGLKPYRWQDVTLTILGNGMAGILVLLCTFYAVLHAWMNGFAEMLRFGDRMFYKDWWTSTSYGRYYRTWNVVVHDWLYTYVYKDMYEIVSPKNKLLAKFMVFFVSALFHEFILGFSFRFCYPVLFVMFFGFGLAFSFVKWEYNTLGNTAVWYGLALGMGIGISTYCMEFYARLNCPIENETVVNYFIPRSLTCNP